MSRVYWERQSWEQLHYVDWNLHGSIDAQAESEEQNRAVLLVLRELVTLHTSHFTRYTSHVAYQTPARLSIGQKHGEGRINTARYTVKW